MIADAKRKSRLKVESYQVFRLGRINHRGTENTERKLNAKTGPSRNRAQSAIGAMEGDLTAENAEDAASREQKGRRTADCTDGRGFDQGMNRRE